MTIASVYYILTICQVRANAGRAAAGGGDMDKHFQDLDANAKINKFLSDYIDHVSFGASRLYNICMYEICKDHYNCHQQNQNYQFLMQTMPLLECEIQGSALGS